MHHFLDFLASASVSSDPRQMLNAGMIAVLLLSVAACFIAACGLLMVQLLGQYRQRVMMSHRIPTTKEWRMYQRGQARQRARLASRRAGLGF